MARKDPRRNISRLDKANHKGDLIGGWLVRFQRCNQKIQRFFSDSVFGGKRKSLNAAKEYRDDVDAQTRTFKTKELAEFPSVRNQSGVVGVRLHREIKLINNHEHHYWFWVAQWTDGRGQRKTRSFSVHQHGDEEAYRMAVSARRKGVQQANR
jgi:hypothetical protein